MKAAIYNPYWDTLGGGERYTISFAKVLEESGYSVDVQWDDPEILKKIEGRFGINTGKIKIVEDIQRGDGYDLCFWVSDGSIPLLHSRKNILHFQVPFKHVNGNSLINKMKFIRIKRIVCNSQFTKNVIDKEYGVKSVVLYPPCDVSKIKPKRKENIILGVGRFSKLLQSKRQDVLIDAFKILSDNGMNNWKLVLVGGSDVGADNFLSFLKKRAKGYNVDFILSPNYQRLIELYGTSKIFWSASGYKEDPIKHPKKMEHFGISLVEAMAAGCIPLVYNGGGYKEILSQFKEFLWNKKIGLVKKTSKAIDVGIDRSTSKELKERAIGYSYGNFKKSVLSII